MSTQATTPGSGSAPALADGLIGVAIFSGSLPATRLALADLDPLFLTCARAAIAGLLAAAALALLRQSRPARADLAGLALVALGVVVGFPLLTALALAHVTAAHAAVFVGLLPLATAVFGAIRAGERPAPAFWLFSGLGSAVTIAFAAGAGATPSLLGDGLMLAAILVCGLGYAEGGILARRLGGWQVIAWAALLSLPLTLPLALLCRPAQSGTVGAPAWAALAYVSLFSMLIGFVFWYRALARGGIAAVSQLQLLQPFLGLGLAALVLGEAVEGQMLVAAAAVAACVAGARRFARPGAPRLRIWPAPRRPGPARSRP
ncbi:DMT family transporter [Methylobacterium durans]|uniref:EamA family transporter n=1 Tax=Methylobacterium durans TaxID=2202825 RepID=A0A2U8WCK7_9HYPH|nr:DMT family transporter [Methylobacterium durans]AWN43895.1 EamA family transporter [Methylobacterium durans]